MYASFFGLRELPFNNTPDPRFFFSTPDHEEALASLVYTVQERKGFVLLTGEVGAGKTLVSRMMLRYFGANVSFATINHTIADAGDLMECVCTELELPVDKGASNAHQVRVLHDYLLSRFSQDVPVVLLLDEAQALPTAAFEQLRMIGNLEADDAKLLQIVIVGQPELQQRFASPQLKQLRQRLFRNFHLPALDRETTEGYISHRLTVAGTDDLDIFDSRAIDRIYDHTQGLPRLINTVCDNALLSGYSADRRTLDGEFVATVIEQMIMAGAQPPTTPKKTTPHYSNSILSDGSREHPQHQAPYAAPLDPSLYAPATPIANPVMDALAMRIQYLETAIPAAIGARYAAAQQPPNVAWPAAPPVSSRVAQQIKQVEERIRSLESITSAGPAMIAQTRDLHRALDPTMQETKAMLGRIQQAMGKLSNREKSVRQMTTKVHALVSEVRQVYDGLKSASSRAARLEKRSFDASRRLAEQAERSRDLTRKLAQPPPVESTRPQTPVIVSRILKEASMPITDVASADCDPRRISDLLGATQKRLADLRTFVRTKRNTTTAFDPPKLDRPLQSTGDTLSTRRLASQVEQLVEMVGSGLESSSEHNVQQFA